MFRRFAEQAQGDAQAVAAMLEEDSDEVDDPGIDRALVAEELEPEGIVFMVARPFPSVYLEGVTIH